VLNVNQQQSITPLVNPFPVPSLEDRIRDHLEDKTDTLYVCPDAWALRHRFINQDTGEVIRVRCGCWRCAYCGPRKVDLWRRVIAEARPTLFVTLTMVGKTVEQAARTLTTWVQAMRRGSKGRGRGRIGARPAYAIEYLAILERHDDFERNGFHWHILIVGIDYLPHEHIEACLLSATKHTTRQHTTRAVCDVRRVNNEQAIGYITKYLMKDITREERGTKVKEREMIELVPDEQGRLVERRRIVVTQQPSHARRIRYSRDFFPEPTQEIRARLFARIEAEGDADKDAPLAAEPEEEKTIEVDEMKQQRSAWVLYEALPFTSDIEVYRWRRRRALEETLAEREGTGQRLARRVVSLWGYYQQHRRAA
jgi:hypothetical protein